MKKFLALSLLISSVGASYGVGFYDQVQTQLKNPATTTTTAVTAAASSKVDISKVNPVYADSVKQIQEAVPVIISSAKLLAPKLANLAQQTAGGGFGGFFSGAISLVGDSATRDAAINLTNVVIATIQTTVKLANADRSTKDTVKGLFSKVIEDPNVAKVIQLAKSVPILGNKLQELINKVVSL